MDKVRKTADMYPIFKTVERATKGNIRYEHAFIATTFLCLAILFVRPVAGPFCNLFAILFILPAATGTISSKVIADAGNTKHVISYLLSCGIINAADSFLPFLHRKIPFYFQMKFILFYYLSQRRTQLTENINSNIFYNLHDIITELNSSEPAQKVKSAQTAASDLINETADAVKQAGENKPKKEE